MKNKKQPLEKSNPVEISSGIDCAALKEFYESPKIIFVPLRVEERLMQCAAQELNCDITPKAS